MSPRRRLRVIARIARWEATRRIGSLDRRTLLVGVGLLLVVGSLGVGAVAVGDVNPSPSADIYRIGVASDSPYATVVERDPALTARPPDAEALATGEIDVLVEGTAGAAGGATAGDSSGSTPAGADGSDGADESDGANGDNGRTLAVETASTPKGEAALTAFRRAVEAENDRRMAREPNETAAYPVTVTVSYRSQSTAGGLPTGGGDGAGDDAGGDVDGGAGGDAGGGGSGGDAGSDDGDGDAEGETDGTDRESDTDDAGSENDATTSSDGGLPGFLNALFGGSSSSPADIQPPFPFSSLVLAFLFLVPMNFVIQAYGSSVLAERINRRGELLLVAPVGRLDIVAGKTLPYLLAALAVIVAIAIAVGGGTLSVLAVAPIALTFLAATFVAAMFARSFKELTFLTVTISVGLTSYVFVPAIFATVTPIALISPLTLVVMELQGEAVGLGQYAFSTAAFYLAAGVLFGLGAGVYREEDMFTQKPVPQKVLDALDVRLDGLVSVGLLTALFIPFVFIAELLAIALLFVAPVELSIPLLLVVIAAIEEVAKIVHVYAGFESGRFARTDRVALAVGAASGVGFFLAEKLTAVAQVVGLPELAVGEAVFASAGVTPSATLALLFAPLALHVVTAGVSALGARRSRRWYLLALGLASVVHAGYNLGVVSLYG